MNDSVLAAVRDGQKGRMIASEFIDTDFAKIAKAFNCQGVRVKRPEEIGPTLQEALKSKDPFVIDVLTDPNEGIRKKTISQWAQKALGNL
jgi:acetolactate synthase-1/2/3 large subunit